MFWVDFKIKSVLAGMIVVVAEGGLRLLFGVGGASRILGRMRLWKISIAAVSERSV